jgi:hypothetical protein
MRPYGVKVHWLTAHAWVVFPFTISFQTSHQRPALFGRALHNFIFVPARRFTNLSVPDASRVVEISKPSHLRSMAKDAHLSFFGPQPDRKQLWERQKIAKFSRPATARLLEGTKLKADMLGNAVM